MPELTEDDLHALGYLFPARPGMTEAEVQTPCLIVDLDAFGRNLARMRDFCATAGIALRPHAKTHKCPEIARHQIGHGAVGICCQKLSEAEHFARAGLPDILLANEIRDPVKIDRLAQLPKLGTRISCCLDDPEAVAVFSAAAQRHGTDLACLVEIDCGAGRCGVATPETAVEIARAIAAAPGLRFDGIQAYQGSMQHIYDHAARAEAAEAAIAQTRAVVAALAAAGLPCRTVTGGGTGSFAFEAASGVYTELQCGSYIFMDADYGKVLDAGGERLDVAGFENALFLLTSVMSHAKPDRAVCDAGLKAQSVDSGLPVVFGRSDVTYLACSDEHGEIADPAGALKINDRLRLVPGHCDPTCNLHDWYVGLRGDRVETLWRITARGPGL
ncbi:DSD1 family PLP-dependent enzyme [Pseudodonghicola flavimaris]|uniref:DSD1 family PLP-dependent enzyme n=1 Tax=Pseudodonghicola flavimaris TaxID=3050036 RepID=A0ABT7EY88_9RHOB|nr:DSD1 family PLP-dependent enzyme [Pseudodonghicola flavimaris]MDK3017306.1 DSD1 family PLP-dependent enzyme [Pseudodonghicola flavimaris]